MIINSTVPQFDTNEIKRGTLIWAKHSSWESAEMGFVVSASSTVAIVLFPPHVRNVTNHFYIPADQVANGDWEIRYSNDLITIGQYPPEEEEETQNGDGEDANT